MEAAGIDFSIISSTTPHLYNGDTKKNFIKIYFENAKELLKESGFNYEHNN